MKALLLSLEGRIPRKTYWMFFVATMAISFAVLALDAVLAGDDVESFPIFTAVFYILIIWPSIAVTAKRWHDRDKSGWWMLISLIPLVGPIWALVENGFLAGTAGDNRFGPSPV